MLGSLLRVAYSILTSKYIEDAYKKKKKRVTRKAYWYYDKEAVLAQWAGAMPTVTRASERLVCSGWGL